MSDNDKPTSPVRIAHNVKADTTEIARVNHVMETYARAIMDALGDDYVFALFVGPTTAAKAGSGGVIGNVSPQDLLPFAHNVVNLAKFVITTDDKGKPN